jgi:DNA polymerase-3 subunit delta
MILQAPYDKLDTRKQVFKIAQETCHIEECAALKKEDIYPLIKTALEKAGKHMDANALEEFVNRTSDNSFLALNELDKLLLYADDLKNINIDIVRRVTTRNLEDNIFELVNAIIAKESKQVTRIYQDLAEVNTDPTAILSLIIGKFQEILYSKELLRMNTSFEDIMKYFNASKGRTYYIVKNAREVSNQQLEKYMQDIEKVDFQIKSGAIDKKMGLEFFLLGI